MKKLTLVHLYPRSMNTYGDRGNIIALLKRCEWHAIDVELIEIEAGQAYDFDQADIVFAGGGQDSNQMRIADDLQERKISIKSAVEKGTVFLTICGTYQLFGHYFKTHENNKLNGISVFDCTTEASNVRKIGNVIIEHNLKELSPTTLVGFENHSGNTRINNWNLESTDRGYEEMTMPLGKVVKGFGNNGTDGFEGARYKNCFGTYMHGSLLPKNPHFADYLIQLALELKNGDTIELGKINDRLEEAAHKFIIKKIG